jgi:hypothetical protein
MKAPAKRGSTLIESAIVLMLFLVILIAVMDFAQVLFFHHVLSERVRTGVRYAAVHPYNETKIKKMVAYNDPLAPADAQGIFGLTPEQVQVMRHSPGTAAERIEVNIAAYSMRFLSPWLAGAFTPGPFRAVMLSEVAQ